MERIEIITTVRIHDVTYSLTQTHENRGSAEYHMSDETFEISIGIGDSISLEVAKDASNVLDSWDQSILGYIVPRHLLPQFLGEFEELEVYPR